MFKAVLLAFLFCTHSYAANLGKELQIDRNPENGHYQLGVSYSYDSGMGDAFVISWQILFKSIIPQQDITHMPEKLKWNFFNPNSNAYLADWNTQPLISGSDLFLVSLATKGDLAKNIIGNQAHVTLVFGDLNGNPLYHLNIGKLCRDLPTYFDNLTNTTTRCHQVAVADIEKEKQKFCDDNKTELLDYVKSGHLICEEADSRFQSLGCGQLQCK